MTDTDDEDFRQELRDIVRPLVARGNRTFADVLDEAVECLLDNDENLNEASAETVCRAEIEAAFASLLAAQETWPEITDCDRLDRAFQALNATGIVARHDFTCCQNCGFAEIGEEIDTARESGTDVSGFTFYHAQDTDRATEGGGLYLSYGHVNGGDANAVAIGRAIVSALNAAGLDADWDGTVGQRIAVRLDWQRRVPASAAVPPKS